jgi:dihydrodipicolinate synthase/N-acetylneuraminate lyase
MRGVHAAIVTHFDGDLKIDHDAVAAQVQRLIAGGVDGIVACGTMGEANSLSRSERDDVVRTAIAAADGRVPVCVGVSAPSAENAAQYARDAAAAGADSLMSLPPLLYRADRRELREFLVEVTAATELPLMVYNNPEASGIDLGPALLAELTRELPAVTAIKETSGDARRIAELLARCVGIDVLVGGDDWALEGACLGAAGWIAGVAVVVPERCTQLWQFGTTGELEQARRLYAELLPLARFDMTSKLVQYFKAALDELGIGGGPCRPPRLPLTDSELEALREATALVAQGATQV